MAEFSRLMITRKGQALIAKMMAGSRGITFTKVSSSDAVYELAQLEGLEKLDNIMQTSVVSKVTRINETTVKVETAFSNTELTEGYYMRALGLYAEDPDEGEILYAAAAEVSGNCYLPAYGGITVSGAYIQLVTTVGNAENVSLEVDNSAQATIGDIKDLQGQIDEMGETLGGVAALAGTNAAKLDKLSMAGSKVYSKEIRVSWSQVSNLEFKIASELPGSEFTSLDADAVYMYVLEQYGLKGQEVRLKNGFRKDVRGYIDFAFAVGGTILNNLYFPLSLGDIDGKFHITPFVEGIGIKGSEFLKGVMIRIRPFLFDVTNENAISDLNETVSGALTLKLTVARIGYDLSVVGGNGEAGLPAGTSNYNLLDNKPSINNVTLKGNLTSEQLGISGGAGSSTEMTYEEAFAILNKEDGEAEG